MKRSRSGDLMILPPLSKIKNLPPIRLDKDAFLCYNLKDTKLETRPRRTLYFSILGA